MTDVDQLECVECQDGHTSIVLRPHAVERGGKLVVVRDVPMLECGNCGETYMTAEIMKQLGELLTCQFAGQADEAIVMFPVAA